MKHNFHVNNFQSNRDRDEFKFKLFEIQQGKCACCSKLLGIKSYRFLDHDHKTGIIRGLVCPSCNRTLGIVEYRRDLLNRPRYEKYLLYLKGGDAYVTNPLND